MYLEGKIIGNRYEIIEKIGTGGMATVYKAKCHVLNRYVAIKILRDEFTTDEEFIKRFNSEAQAAASLNHPNIVSIFDVGHEDNLHYIVMELIQGKTLKQIIDEDGALPWKWSVNIVIQIASALEVAHKNGIIHRDIKPHNIIITEDGVAKVMDFGIAKAVSNSTITAFGTTIGSVHYFSPEHAKGGYTDQKSDIYSLGVVMYEMLTGRVPFDADTPVSIALKHMQEKPIEPMKLNPTIPFAVDKIIMRAMQKEASLRYQSATEMLVDLKQALKNPEGNFVEDVDVTSSYTQVVPTLDDEEIGEKYSAPYKERKKHNKIVQYFADHPKMKIVAFIVGALLIIGLAYGVTSLIMNKDSVKDVEMIQVVNKDGNEVKSELEKLGLKVEVQEEYNADVEKGKVISSDPEYKDHLKVKGNSTVKLVVSKGVEVVKMPTIKGKKYDDAVKLLEEVHLKAEKVEQTSKTVEAGTVIKQEPDPNSDINAGETVKVYVSSGTGIKQVSVPYVLNKTQDEAKSELEGLGLKVTVVEEENRDKTDGTIIKQSIDTGKVVDEGTSIVITVNKIAQLKNGIVNVNVANLISSNIDKDKVKLTITVGNDKVFDKEVDINKTVTQTVSGYGTINVKVYINDTKEAENQMDLNDENGKVWNVE